jgi:hypothetical protein
VTNRVFLRAPNQKAGTTHWLVAGLAPLDLGHLEVTNRSFLRAPYQKAGATSWLVAGLAPLDLGHLEVTNKVLFKGPLIKKLVLHTGWLRDLPQWI